MWAFKRRSFVVDKVDGVVVVGLEVAAVVGAHRSRPTQMVPVGVATVVVATAQYPKRQQMPVLEQLTLAAAGEAAVLLLLSVQGGLMAGTAVQASSLSAQR
jgi:hypothetical protein